MGGASQSLPTDPITFLTAGMVTWQVLRLRTWRLSNRLAPGAMSVLLTTHFPVFLMTRTDETHSEARRIPVF